MIKKIILLTAGVALASIAVPVSAQTMPVQSLDGQPVAQSAPAAVSTATSGRLEDYERVLVEGDLEENSHRTLPPNEAGYLRQGSRHSWYDRRGWRARGWSDADFNRIRTNNHNLCQRTAAYTLRLETLAQRFAGHGEAYTQLIADYERLGNRIRRGGFLRTLGNILSIGAGFALGGPGYAAVVAGGVIGSEGQGRANQRQSQLNRRHSILNAEHSRDNAEFNILATEVYVDYLGMVNEHCERQFGGGRVQ